MENFEEKINREIREEEERWESLSQEEKDKEEKEEEDRRKELNHKEALRIKEYVEKYVPVEEIVPGTNTQDFLKTSEAFRGKQVEDVGKENPGDVGEGLTSMYIDKIFRNLNDDRERNEGKRLEKIKEYFADRPVVDLGAGPWADGYHLSRILGSSGYVGVEPSKSWEVLESRLIKPSDDPLDLPIFFGKETKEAEIIPFAIAPEDALTFLKRLPDHSVGIINSGTDSCVLFGEGYVSPEKEERAKKYISEVNKEIVRVLHPDSALISVDSVFGRDGSLEFSEEDSDSYSSVGGYKIFKLKQI